MDILSVWPGGVPDSLFVYDIPSTMHVLDLAIVLVKTLTLGLALLSMHAFVAASTGTSDPAEALLWAGVVAVSLAWLVVGARRMRPPDRPWLRATVW